MRNRYAAAVVVLAFVSVLAGPPAVSASDLTWTSRAPLLTGRVGLQAETVDGIVYAIGGTAGGCPQPPAFPTEAYDPATDTWTAKAALLPQAPNGGQRTSFATAVVDGKIYAFGGGNCLTFFNDVQAYDPATNVWSIQLPMPTSRVYHAAAPVNGKIYLIGGLVSDPGPAAPTQEYDPATETWTAKAPMPTPRIRAGAAVIDGKIYVVGGSTTGAVALASVDIYDPATDTWASAAPMAMPRTSPAVAVAGGLLYVFGGSNAAFAIVASGEVYDPAVDTWAEAPSLPAPRVAAGSAVLDDVPYVIGGQSDTLTGNSTTFALLGASPPLPATQPPTADFAVGAVRIEGEPVTFDASASHDNDSVGCDAATDTRHCIVRYAWDFGDGTMAVGTAPSTSHVYTSAGAYSATLTVTDNDGETASVPYAVVVAAAPPPTPQQAIEHITATVRGLVGSDVLTSSIAGALTPKLGAAAQAIARGNTTAAKGQIGAFVNQVKALVKSGRLSSSEGQALIAAANAVIAALGR